MRNVLGIFLILVIGFTSCEGRKTSNQALSESIEEFKKDVTLQIDVYEPETYIEREVDTLLSNGYHVKIKTYTDLDNSVLFTKIKDTINYQIYYRNFKFDILVEKDGKLIYQEHYDKSRINKALGYSSNINSSIPTHNFNKSATLKSIQIDDELSTNKAIFIDIAYTIPNTEFIDWHKLKINSKGQAKFVTL